MLGKLTARGIDAGEGLPDEGEDKPPTIDPMNMVLLYSVFEKTTIRFIIPSPPPYLQSAENLVNIKH